MEEAGNVMWQGRARCCTSQGADTNLRSNGQIRMARYVCECGTIFSVRMRIVMRSYVVRAEA